MTITIRPVNGLPEIRAGHDLASMLTVALGPMAPENGDVLVVTQKIVSKAEGAFRPAADEAAYRQIVEEEAEAAPGKLDENKIGGSPVFMQGDEFPFEGTCRLLLQLDSCSVPFYVNFGDSGVGYAFLNETGDRAKFLWQCG